MLPRRDLPRPENEKGAENEEEQMETEAHPGTPQIGQGLPSLLQASVENSPVASLSGSLSQLSTNSQRQTPKRNLEMSGDDAAPGPSSEGVFLDSPTPIYSPSSELWNRSQRRMNLRRVSSSPDLKVYGYGTTVKTEAEDSSVASSSGVGGSGGGRSGSGLSSQPIMEEEEGEDSEMPDKVQDPGLKDRNPSDSQGDVGNKDSAEKDPLPRKLSKGFKRSLAFGSDPGLKDLNPSDSQGDVGNKDSAEKDPPPREHSKGFKRSLFSDQEGEKDNTGSKTPLGLKRTKSMLKDEQEILGDLMASSDSDEEVRKKRRRRSALAGEKRQEAVVAEPSASSVDTPPATVPSATAKSMKPDYETPVREYRLAKRGAQSQAVDLSAEHRKRLDIFAQSPPTLSPGSLRRSLSLTEDTIKDAVRRMSELSNVIADSSKMCLLPTISGKHQDLKTISHETMADVLKGKYAEKLENYAIVDCRYPYEYAGGHIKGAVNIYTKDMLLDKYLKNPVKVQDPEKRYIIIFHCEFSSERAPSLYRQLRAYDRQTNSHRYPDLFYPEVYLLDRGYSAFYLCHRDLCEPRNYVSMLHKDYSEALAKYQAERKKSKKNRRESTLDRSSVSGGANRSLKL